MTKLKEDYLRYRQTGHSNADLLFLRGFHAVACYRFRRWLWQRKIPFLHVIIGYFAELFTGVELPVTVDAGGGLVVYHSGPLHVIGAARLGSNVGLRPGVVIGGDYGGGGAPVLGSHIEVGVGAKIIGNVQVGDHSRIGANAVVTRSFPPHSVLVGIPARPVTRGAA